MCKPIVSQIRSSHQSEEPTPAIRAERRRELDNLTPERYADLLFSISHRWVFFDKTVDPQDALNEALCIALTEYDGRGRLHGFVYVVAYHWAKEVRRRHVSRRVNLKEDEDLETRFASFLRHTDPELIEELDDHLIQVIREKIDAIQDPNPMFKYRHAADNAKKLLRAFSKSADQGTGIGVDEYENVPMKPWRLKRGYGAGRPPHNQKETNKAITVRAQNELNIEANDFYQARRALRQATLQALRER